MKRTLAYSARSRLAPVLGLIALLAASLFCAQYYHDSLAVQAEPNNAEIKNPIDKFVLERLASEKLQPSPICSDDEFCRRVYVDVCGIIPTASQLKLFMADRSPDKREKLVDTLLKNPRYAEAWSVLWGDLLREHSNSKPKEGTERGSYREFLRESLAKNTPYDHFARQLITATGGAEEDPAVNFYLRDEANRVETSNTVASVFMGTRMACAQCHDHPFDKWTQQDFHSLMAFFGRTNVAPDPVETLLKIDADTRIQPNIKKMFEPYIKEAKEAETKIKAKHQELAADLGSNKGGGMAMGMSMEEMQFLGKGRDMLKEIDKNATKEEALRAKQVLQQHQARKVVERNQGDYRMPSDGDGANKKKPNGGEVVSAVFPWDPTRKSEGAGSRRKALADFIVASPMFAKVQVNRLWTQLMGRGIVDPGDDFREKNQPTHPELLDYLADEFAKSKFDNQHMLKLILNSSTYQRSSIPNTNNRSDTSLYSHQRLRRMTAEAMFDSVLVATGHDNGMEGMNIDIKSMAGGKGGARYIDKQNIQWAADLPTPARTGSFLNLFNQPNREQLSVKRDETGSISQALEMMNGRTIADALSKSPAAAKFVSDKMSPQQIITEMYLAVLSRQPTVLELNYLGAMLKANAPTREWIDDIYWALLNSREFTFVK
jgi:hypothetical protein